MYQDRVDQGFMLIDVVIENESSQKPDERELLEWADNYGMTFPVVTEDNATSMWEFAGGGSVGLPFTVLIDRGVVVESTNYPSEQDIDRLL